MRHSSVESLHAARVVLGSTLFHGNHEVQLLLPILLCDSKDVSSEGFMEHVLKTLAQDGSPWKTAVFS